MLIGSSRSNLSQLATCRCSRYAVLLGVYQLSYVLTRLGIFLGFVANLIVVSYVVNSSASWRILTNTVLIPTIPLLLLIYLMPESPRYLMKHGNYKKALLSFEILQTTHLLASRDFMYAHAQLDFVSDSDYSSLRLG